MNDILTNFMTPPINLINQELESIYGKVVLSDMSENIKLYEVYERGSKFTADNKDLTPSQLRYKIAKTLIDKQTRFLFSKPVDVKVMSKDTAGASEIQNVIDDIMEKNKFHHKLIQASKDCFIAKRVACFLTFNDDGVGIRFAPSLEFVYDVSPDNPDILEKIVAFYIVEDSSARSDQRIYRKKYEMDNGFCYVEEGIYNGAGELLEEKIPRMKTRFTYIPAVVIINGGLTGDLLGESDIADVMDYESYYSKMSNADMDAERGSMHPIKWLKDVSPESSKHFKLAPGALWDAKTDPSAPEGISASLGQLESQMTYTTALDTTLKRIKATMYEQLDVPDIATMQSKLSSGKELETIYWGLMVRCDEKFIAWREALKFIFLTAIDGLKLYPESRKIYGINNIPEIEFDLDIENQYPLPGDEVQEKSIDLTEIGNKTRSIKSYLVKWRGMTPDEADEEISQIAKERQILEDSFFGLPGEGDEE